MEPLSRHPLFHITAEDEARSNQEYSLDDNKIKDYINIISDWCKKQEHLVEASEYLTPQIIRRLIILSRGSIEALKTKIDSLLTLRGMMPEIILDTDIDDFTEFTDNVAFVPMPNLDNHETRILIQQHFSEDWHDFNLQTCLRYIFMMGEYRTSYDYNICERYIIDLKNFTLNELAQFSPIVVRKVEILLKKGYGVRIKGIHMLNAPVYADMFISLLKQVLSKKLASRLHVHESYKDLHNYISKACLPEDYGGDGPSVAKLHKQWIQYLKSDEARKILENSKHLKADESKRNYAKFNEEYLGMPGSFRKLNVD